MTSNANSMAAVAAAVQGIDEAALEALVASDKRLPTAKNSSGSKAEEVGMRGRPVTANPGSATSYRNTIGSIVFDSQNMDGGSAVVDGPILAESNENISKARARRASEGQFLTKTEGKRASGELRCEKCGKGYKHSSCLTKHLLVFLNSIFPDIFSILVFHRWLFSLLDMHCPFFCFTFNDYGSTENVLINT